MLMRDMGFYDHTVGLYFESKDGLNWQNPQIGWFGNGKPAYLFTASQGGKAETSSGFVFKIKPE